MVNADMFRNTIPARQPQPQPQYHYPHPPQPQTYHQPVVHAPVAPAPVYPQQPAQPPRPPVPEDPEVEKFRLRMMKILFWLVGGAAILLLVWRIILKFI